MDFRQVLAIGFMLLGKIRLPTGVPPPEPDLLQLYKQSRAKVAEMSSPLFLYKSPSPHGVASTTLPASEPFSTSPSLTSVATACVPCLRAHVSAASGALTEALRMARTDGMANPEVAERIRLAQDEIVIAERKDLTPEVILRASPEEKKVIEWFLPRVRELRQHIILISSPDDLLRVSAEANALGRDLTLRHLEAKGVDVEGVIDIANQVKNGSMTLDQAKERVKALLPAGET